MRRFLLWIDGVGSVLVLTGDQVSVGRVAQVSMGASDTQPRSGADIALFGNLSREQATIQRLDECYFLTPHGQVTLNHLPVSETTLLGQRATIELNNSVHLEFVVPSPLSRSARITVTSPHRSAQGVCSHVLMAETCLLGRGPQHHIHCPEWTSSVVLVRQGQNLAVHSAAELLVDDERPTGLATLRSGQVISGDGFRFRLEELAP